jgi:hypothetical protein
MEHEVSDYLINTPENILLQIVQTKIKFLVKLSSRLSGTFLVTINCFIAWA